MKARIRNLADIHTGYQFRGSIQADPAGDVRVIQIKDVGGDGTINLDGLVPVKLARPEPYLAHQGDVLFLARGYRLHATPITQPIPNAIVTGYFFILRPNGKVMPRYLAWFINQLDFQQKMRAFIKGTHQPMVAKADFQEMEIEVPPLAMQDKIVRLDDLMEEERRLVAAIEEKRAKLVQAISMQAACGRKE
jgi:hypothetical protein